MLQEIVRSCVARASHVIYGAPEIDSVPIDDRGSDEIEAGGPITLVFQRPIGEATLLMKENGLIERVPRLALVQTSMTSPTEFWALQPIKHEQCALKPAKFGKCKVELILPRKRTELLQDHGGRHRAGFDGSGEPNDLVPMVANYVDADRTAK